MGSTNQSEPNGYANGHRPSRDRHLPEQRWQVADADPVIVHDLVQATGLPPILAQVLIQREITTPDAAQIYLHPGDQLLPSPMEEFPDLPQCVERLEAAIATGEKIAICGDYDADGMTSTALLLRALRYLGAEVDYAIPSRMSEGYGINERIVEEFHAEGVSIILTVDNGIAAYDPIQRAQELGVTVIVTDHHDVPERIPPAAAILNPKLLPETSVYRGVAGVGVAYILAVCVAQALGRAAEITAPLLELFTLGTIADLAPLTGVNRRWLQKGLRILPKSRIPGIQALIQVAGLSDQTKPLRPEAIGFRLGPRINAVGRLADPQIVIEMLTTADEGIALERAMQCEQINRQRQELCTEIEAEAIALCDVSLTQIRAERVLLIVQPGWHHGVIGIVASRLVERYGVPVFIGTFEQGEPGDPPMVRGSARSIPEFNVFDALCACDDLLEKYGGHAAAGGFTFAAEHLEAVRSRLSEFAHGCLTPEQLKPLVRIDGRADLTDLTLELYEQMDQLQPCGIQNPDPVFWTPQVRVLDQRIIGKTKEHLKVTLVQDWPDGRTSEPIKAIAWRWAQYYPLPAAVDIAYQLRLNEWQGERSVELELVGARSPQSDPADVAPGTGEDSLDANDSLLDSTEFADTDGRQAQSRSLWTRVNFFYNKRQYACSLSPVETTNPTARELRIRNPEGQILAVQLQQRRGLLGVRREDAKEVDVTHPHYFNLIRAALNALELQQKTYLLAEKDQLMAEKDKQVETLHQQLSLLEEKLNQLSTAQQERFQTLRIELHSQEQAIRDHEAHIADLQGQLEHSSVAPDAQDIQRQVIRQLSPDVWNQLQPRSQRDLCAAYKNYHVIQAEGFTSSLADYSEAGLRLGFAVEREIVHPFFTALYDYLLVNGGTEIGGLRLGPKRKYTLGMLPPLLAERWDSLRDNLLKQREPVDRDRLYYLATMGKQVNRADHRRIQAFLAQWSHPLAAWLGTQAPAAAYLDQINKLRNNAAHAESFLYAWQYDLLRQIVLGTPTQPGIFRQIFTVSVPSL